jgi:hypothetical protein
MKVTKIAFRPFSAENDKGTLIGFANVTIEFAKDVEMTLYNVELNVWDDNGFAIRTPRHKAPRNGQWYTDAFLSDKFRNGLANAILKDRVVAAAADAATEERDARKNACESDEKDDNEIPF